MKISVRRGLLARVGSRVMWGDGWATVAQPNTRTPNVENEIMSKGKAKTVAVFSPDWSDGRGSSSWKECEAAGLRLALTPDGERVIFNATRSAGKAVSAATVLLYGRACFGPDAPLTAFGEFVDGLATAALANGKGGKKKVAASVGEVAFGYERSDGEKLGCTAREMQTMIDKGHIDRESVVTARGMDGWKPASDVVPVRQMLDRRLPL